jgi:hypothetical protein
MHGSFTDTSGIHQLARREEHSKLTCVVTPVCIEQSQSSGTEEMKQWNLWNNEAETATVNGLGVLFLKYKTI